jgi:hypothetical protein
MTLNWQAHTLLAMTTTSFEKSVGEKYLHDEPIVVVKHCYETWSCAIA